MVPAVSIREWSCTSFTFVLLLTLAVIDFIHVINTGARWKISKILRILLKKFLPDRYE